MSEWWTVVGLVGLLAAFFAYVIPLSRRQEILKESFKRFIASRHPEISIETQVGFGYVVKINGKLYVAALREVFGEYKKQPAKADDIFEEYISSLPVKHKPLGT